MLAVAITACTDSRPIEDDVVRPGVSAIGQASALACTTDAETLQAAIEAYTAVEGVAPLDEAALVASGVLRQESELWDLLGGELLPADEGCGTRSGDAGSVPADPLAAVESLGAELASMTPERYLTEVDEAEIAAVGGRDCAREVAVVALAYARWTLDHRGEPATLRRLVDDGTLPELERWTIRAATLDPAAGSGCIGPITLIER